MIRSGFIAMACGVLLACDATAPPATPDASEPSSPNIVVVCIDTLRADHTSVYGYSRETTPNLERVAAEGFVARHFSSNAPWTKPSVASIISGLHPTAHGSRVGQFGKVDEGESRQVDLLSDRIETLAEVFQAAGYRTVAHITNYNIAPQFGYGQGYDDYRFVGNATWNGRVNQSDAAAVEYAIDALDQADQPVFAWVHMMSVHQYVAPAEFQVFEPETTTPIDPAAKQVVRVEKYRSLERAIADYDQSIRYCDSLVGQLFDAVRDRHSNTVILVCSDHGEEFYEHGGFEHAHTLYNEMTRVPCILWGPGVPVGESHGIADTLDLFPTLTALAGIDAESSFRHGQSLIEDGKVATSKSETFAEQHHRGPHRCFSLVRDGGKFLLSRKKQGTEESVQYFPGGDDRQPPLTDEPDPELRQRVELYQRRNRQIFLKLVGEKESAELTDADYAALKALGYAK